jgi:hypothetical protein
MFGVLWAMFGVLITNGTEYENFQDQQFDITEQTQFEGKYP